MSLLPFSCVMFYVIATLQLCNFNFITSDGCSVGLMLEGVSEDTIRRLDMVGMGLSLSDNCSCHQSFRY